LKNGTSNGCGIRPRTTIGSEKTTRISFASAIVAVSPTGPALTTRKVSAANSDAESSRKASAATTLLITPCSVVRHPTRDVTLIANCEGKGVAGMWWGHTFAFSTELGSHLWIAHSAERRMAALSGAGVTPLGLRMWWGHTFAFSTGLGHTFGLLVWPKGRCDPIF
jgi:hypothetical protein